jgi:hypothetical protein
VPGPHRVQRPKDELGARAPGSLLSEGGGPPTWQGSTSSGRCRRSGLGRPEKKATTTWFDCPGKLDWVAACNLGRGTAGIRPEVSKRATTERLAVAAGWPGGQFVRALVACTGSALVVATRSCWSSYVVGVGWTWSTSRRPVTWPAPRQGWRGTVWDQSSPLLPSQPPGIYS